MKKDKRLYRSRDNKVFAGVIGGLGEYFDIDPVLLRVIWIFILFATGVFPGVIAYIIAIFIMPKEPKHTKNDSHDDSHE